LRWLAAALLGLALLAVGRLIDIQVVRAGHYRELADRLLTHSRQYLPAPRGSILDRHGRLLVSDEPTSDVTLHYRVIAALVADEPPAESRQYFRAVARELRQQGRYPPDKPTAEIVGELLAGLEPLLGRLSALTGLSRERLLENARAVCRRVRLIRAAVGGPVREETLQHAVATDLPDAAALAVRLELEPQCPWLRVVPSARRQAHDADTLVHLLGRLGDATPERIANDPFRDDELRGLRPGDRCGVSGVERLAELTLRGTRGLIISDFDRTILLRREPVRGQDVYLTIDAELQRAVYAILADAVERSEHPAGGAAVVIDVPTREVLALVSYPAYAYDRFSADYQRLRRDTRRLPLRFRAVAGQYPPGSTCKVIGLYGALAAGVVAPHERIHCTGHLLPDKPDRFRCWIYNQYGVTHDMRGNPAGQDAEDAIRNSCNIYFFTVGQRLGAGRLCEWFERFGLGRVQATGLIEESPGIVPTEQWLRTNRGRGFLPADAWNYAIGQGEVTATPLQAANVAATVAAGRWQPVRLLRDPAGDAGGKSAPPPVEFDERHLRILRAGMWRVVNERGGTAYWARLDRDDFVLCGKTGSAQAMPRVLNRRYFCRWPDGREQTVIATCQDEALAQFVGDEPEIVGWRAHERYPAWEPGDELPAHAWFIGYTQSADTPRGAPPRGRSYALSVIIEYGGSGGRVAGPVAKRIAELLLE